MRRPSLSVRGAGVSILRVPFPNLDEVRGQGGHEAPDLYPERSDRN